MDQGKVIYDQRIPGYKQPRRRKPNRPLLILTFLFLLCITVTVYMQSSWSKLQEVEIHDNEIVHDDAVLDYAQLERGVFYFGLRTSEIQATLEERPEFEGVEVTRILPNRLRIQVEETPVVAFWLEEDSLFPLFENGFIAVDHRWDSGPLFAPILNNWSHQEGIIEFASELAQVPVNVLAMMSDIHFTPTVSDPYMLTIYMSDGFKVKSSIRNFADNVQEYPYLVQEVMNDGYARGVFHLFDAKWFERPETEIEDEVDEDDNEMQENELLQEQ